MRHLLALKVLNFRQICQRKRQFGGDLTEAALTVVCVGRFDGNLVL